MKGNVFHSQTLSNCLIRTKLSKKCMQFCVLSLNQYSIIQHLMNKFNRKGNKGLDWR